MNYSLTLFDKLSGFSPIAPLYGMLVTHARQPALFTEFSVPDTFAGRLELVFLHICAGMRRFDESDPKQRAFTDMLFRYMFKRDLDRQLREIGVGDLSVSRKIRFLAESFQGRMASMSEALDSTGDDLLIAFLIRNVYAGEDPGDRDMLGAFAGYVRAVDAAIQVTPPAALMRGEVDLPRLEEVTKAGHVTEMAG